MIEKEKKEMRFGIKNKHYMETEEEIEETAKDLLPLCQRCNEFKGLGQHNFQECRGKPCIELY